MKAKTYALSATAILALGAALHLPAVIGWLALALACLFAFECGRGL